MLGRGNDRFVRIVVAEVDISFLLKCRIEPAVVNAQSNELDVLALDGTLGNSCIL